ncbi:MAG: HD domain-containing protein [Nannocystaceae bacterium]|nr:HD domain-containing protein [bacterium]
MILRDPVHGLISFEGPAESIISRLLDTRELQRLRRVRCLGPASLAFPGAEHTRFAHAVGSAHVMKRYLDRVYALSDDLPAADQVDHDTAQVALAAALLHDLGHGPYSHAFEAVLPHPFKHEDWTSRLILDPDSEVHAVLRQIDSEAPGRVERLVHGEGDIPHLARAVSGTFDVDRCDYLLRDSHMTGVRYGVLDLDWLLQSMRLMVAPGEQRARMAVDGEKGLTAVEGFFLGRLYMYRQVYLHKAVRAAESVMRALFRRLDELGPQPGTPAGMAKLLVGQEPTMGEFLDLDDHAFEQALKAYCTSTDPILAELAGRMRYRRLFKTLRLRHDVPVARAMARLREVLDTHHDGPDYLAAVDRVEVAAYYEDSRMMAYTGGRLQRLLDVSPVLHGLSNETFVHYRLIFPPELRAVIKEAFVDLR